MKKKDLIFLGALTSFLVGGIALMLIQQRVPPGMGEQHITPGEAGYFGREDPESGEPVTAVFWISVDGFRPDYLDRAETPFFDRILAEGAYSREHQVVFPSLTFPSHVSQATGVPVREHGIPMNRFYDSETGAQYHYPGDSRLLETEPIWTTAARQGLRVISLDWPLAHAQTGPHAAEIFDPEFPRGLSDAERLRRPFQRWLEDKAREPFRLTMGYAAGPDRPGHRYGPDSDEVIEAVERIDALLGAHYQALVARWNERMAAEDRFYFIITSDHGMSPVRTLVHPERLTGIEASEGVQLMFGANVAHVYLDSELPPEQRKNLTKTVLNRIDELPFARAHTRDTLPPEWAYDHPSRTGDLVIALDPGYSFSRTPEELTVDAAEAGGPLGMHGYDPREDPNMQTIAFFQRHPRPLGGVDLGPVHSLQLHPTVARLLNIQPAAGATAEPIELEPGAARD